jgi:hypothetical protein
MHLTEIGWGGIVWVNLAEDKDQWQALVEHSNEPLGLLNFGKFLSS